MQNNIIDKVFNKVIESNCFENKETSLRLLKFLFESTRSGAEIKEVHIAEGVFGRDKQFNSADDAIVRVNIHKIRQLLDAYYATEGKDDAIRISVSKGKYKLIFRENVTNNPNQGNRRFSNNYLRFMAVFLLASIGINIYFAVVAIKKNVSESNPVWHHYIESQSPTMVVMGNPFFLQFEIKNDTKSIIVRDLSINALSDDTDELLDLFVDPEIEISPLKFPYFSKNNVWPLIDIVSQFKQYNKELEFAALTDFNPDLIKRNNIIFVGNINSFGLFEHYLKKSNINIVEGRYFTLSDTVSYVSSGIEQERFIDYGFIIKIPGENGHIITMIGDFHSTGNKGIMELLTSPDKLEHLNNLVKQNYKAFPDYFEMIVKVSSYNYSNLNTEIVYFSEIATREAKSGNIP